MFAWEATQLSAKRQQRIFTRLWSRSSLNSLWYATSVAGDARYPIYLMTRFTAVSKRSSPQVTVKATPRVATDLAQTSPGLTSTDPETARTARELDQRPLEAAGRSIESMPWQADCHGMSQVEVKIWDLRRKQRLCSSRNIKYFTLDHLDLLFCIWVLRITQLLVNPAVFTSHALVRRQFNELVIVSQPGGPSGSSDLP